MAALAGVCSPPSLGGDRMNYTQLDTLIGRLTIVAEDAGLRRIQW
jgi:hypothetical protein